MMEHQRAVSLVQVLIKLQSRRGAPQKISELCLARGERIMSVPSSSIRSKAHMNTLSSVSHRRISSKLASPSSPQAMNRQRHGPTSPTRWWARDRLTWVAHG